MKCKKIMSFLLCVCTFYSKISNAGEFSQKFDRYVEQHISEVNSSLRETLFAIANLSNPDEDTLGIGSANERMKQELDLIIGQCEIIASPGALVLLSKDEAKKDEAKKLAQRNFNECLKGKNYFERKEKIEKEMKNYRKSYEIAKKAHPLMAKAAQEGNEKAIYAYALYKYYRQKESIKVRDMFLKATESNNVEISNDAHRYLARMYAAKVTPRLSSAVVLKRDVKKALYHLGKACDNGDNWACETYNGLIELGYSE